METCDDLSLKALHALRLGEQTFPRPGSLVACHHLLLRPDSRELERLTRRGWGKEDRAGGAAADLFPGLFILEFGWQVRRGPRSLRSGVFPPDFHEVRPAEVETERQDRSERQAELGWRRGRVPASDRGIHFHQGSVLSWSYPSAGWGPLFMTYARGPSALQTPLCTGVHREDR